MYSITLDSSGDIYKIETSIAESLKKIDSNESLLLDLTSLSFINLETIFYLLSLISGRKKNGQETKIKYFANDQIRDFLHTTRFFEVLKDVAGLSVQETAIDLPDDFDSSKLAVDSFDRPKYEYDQKSGETRQLSEKERIENLRRKGFYPLVSLPFSDDVEKSCTLKDEPKNWTEGKPLISIVQRNLPEKVLIGDKISKHIIYESITNSIRHPNSNKLVLSCIKQGKFYKLIIWDNGEGIIQTLKRELEKGNSIKTKDDDADPHSCYCIVREKKPGPARIENFDFYFSDEVPNLNEAESDKEYKKQDWFILLASLFPGITRDPSGTDYQESAALNTVIKPPLTGRGLTYLVNAAVRNFGGEVRIRTNSHFVNIKRAEKDYVTLPDLFFKKFKDQYYVIDMKDKYDAEGILPKDRKIINSLFRAKVDESKSSFYGNMITVHIPQQLTV